MGTVLQSKLEGQDERTAQRDRHCYTYLGRDPEGPLAPLGDPNPLLHRRWALTHFVIDLSHNGTKTSSTSPSPSTPTQRQARQSIKPRL